MSNLPWYHMTAMVCGYLLGGALLLYVLMAMWVHTWWVLTEVLAEIRFGMRRGGIRAINWHRLPDHLVRRWFGGWADPFFGCDSIRTWNDLGSWTSPRHPFSLGTYVWYERDVEDRP